ncbi:hypothetical protein B0H14DRAFT_2691953 [Mycena olivaceomarginata]|nr:hypothetical protein B0H14DRAFT_2691953 [Mycena olivaceomarginata]
MILISTAVLTSLFFLGSAASLGVGTSANDAMEARSAQTCGNPADAAPLFRAYNPTIGDHFYTTNASELQVAVISGGYTREQNAALVFTTQVLSSVPLYRLYSFAETDHLYTTSVEEMDSAIANGYTYEKIAAYVYPSEICGATPLYRLFNQQMWDHFYTMSVGEVDFAETGGYVLEGIKAYALPPQ